MGLKRLSGHGDWPVCVQVAPFQRSQTLAGTSLDLVFLDELGAAEVQELGPGICDFPSFKNIRKGLWAVLPDT